MIIITDIDKNMKKAKRYFEDINLFQFTILLHYLTMKIAFLTLKVGWKAIKIKISVL